jgi:GT2 family glycosyltransferase
MPNPAGLQPLPTVVIATRNRRERLLATLGRVCSLPDRPPIVVIDNASDDGTAAAVRGAYPNVLLIEAGPGIGAAARPLGVRAADTPLVAFSDDDSWWADDALAEAEALFDRYPRLGLIAARTLVGPENRPDPITPALRSSPLGTAPDLPGPSVLGFIACSAIVRRDAFLQVGGFSPVLFFLCEERLLAWDLAAAGWGLSYVEHLVAHHHPSTSRPHSDARRRRELRNDLLATWMRRRPRAVLSATSTLGRSAVGDPVARGALGEALVRLPAVLRNRRGLPSVVERQVSLLEQV